VSGSKAQGVQLTCQVTLKVRRSVSCWDERLMPGSSLQWEDRRPAAEKTSSPGTIFTTRLKRLDRELSRAPVEWWRIWW